MGRVLSRYSDYGLDGRGSNPGGARFSAVQTGPGAHPTSCTMGTGSFLGVKYSQGVLLTTHPLLVPRSGRVELFLYPPSGQHQGLLWGYFNFIFYYLNILNTLILGTVIPRLLCDGDSLRIAPSHCNMWQGFLKLICILYVLVNVTDSHECSCCIK